MNIPESFNSYKDEDGCPDTLLRPSASETKTLNTKLRAINFKSGNAELLSVSFAALDYIADFLRQFPHLRYEIQGHTDSQGSDEYNLVLSAARAGTVRGYLVVKGINDSSLIAIGYGESSPVADNSTSLGRATNRRVDFKIIESTQEYSDLKMKETVTRDIVRAAKIKGSQY
jgi:outer membrane protein OmpA-like peptidoglycan-associated protein